MKRHLNHGHMSEGLLGFGEGRHSVRWADLRHGGRDREPFEHGVSPRIPAPCGVQKRLRDAEHLDEDAQAEKQKKPCGPTDPSGWRPRVMHRGQHTLSRHLEQHLCVTGSLDREPAVQ